MTWSGVAATRSCKPADALQSTTTMGSRPANASISDWSALVLPLPVAPQIKVWLAQVVGLNADREEGIAVTDAPPVSSVSRAGPGP